MSRDSNGNYTLPASGNPVITGTVVSSAWANSTLNDVASALTDSLSRSGLGGMTAAFKLSDGSAAAPSMTFTNEPTTGIYRQGANLLGFTISGTQRLLLGTTTLVSSGQSIIFGGTPTPGNATLTVGGPTNGGASIIVNSVNSNTITSSDLSINRNSSSTGVGLGPCVQFGDNGVGTSGLIQFDRYQGISVWAFGTSWNRGVTIDPVTYGMSVYAPLSNNYPALTVDSSAYTAVGRTMILQSNSSSAGVFTLILNNTNALGQNSIAFYANGVVTNNIRADYSSGLTLSAYSTGGGFNYYIGGDAGVGALKFTISNTNSQFISTVQAGQPTLIVNGSATQGITSLKHADSVGNVYETGFIGSPINAQGTYTIARSDAGKTIEVTSGSTYTLPNGLPGGTIILFRNLSGGNCTISAAGTLTWYGTGASGTRTLATAGKAICELSAGGVWLISGINLT